MAIDSVTDAAILLLSTDIEELGYPDCLMLNKTSDAAVQPLLRCHLRPFTAVRQGQGRRQIVTLPQRVGSSRPSRRILQFPSTELNPGRRQAWLPKK